MFLTLRITYLLATVLSDLNRSNLKGIEEERRGKTDVTETKKCLDLMTAKLARFGHTYPPQTP